MKTMKILVKIMVPALLIVLMSGCWPFTDPKPCEPITEYKYIEKPIPEIQEKPEFIEYSIMMVNFKGEDYYVIPKADGYIMSGNWDSYRGWCEGNFKILKDLKDVNNTK